MDPNVDRKNTPMSTRSTEHSPMGVAAQKNGWDQAKIIKIILTYMCRQRSGLHMKIR